MEFNLENPLTSFGENQSDTIPVLFASEPDHMPSLAFNASDVRFAVRQEAMSLILEAQFSWNFEPFLCYLAGNYIDRFISKQELPQGKPWIPRLLVVSCLSLAAKMKNVHLSLSDLQRDGGLIFNAHSIHRMELLILAALNWRMRSITPFSFLCFFLSLFQLKDPPLTRALRGRALEIIFKTYYEMNLLEYKPSLIAASALICASHDLFPSQYAHFRAEISSCEYVNKEKLQKCLSAVQEMVVAGYEHAVSSSTKTPTSVLDRLCTNSESESGASETSVPGRDRIKRRRLSGFGSDRAFQLSQSQPC